MAWSTKVHFVEVFCFLGIKMCKAEELKEVDCDLCSGVRDQGRYRINEKGENEVHCRHAGGFTPVPKVKSKEICPHLKKVRK